MSRLRVFASWLAPHFQRFVALKRAGGAGYDTEERLLCAFDRHVGEHAPSPPLRREALLRYLTSLDGLSDRGRDNIIGVVWPAVAHAQRNGASVESLPTRPARGPRHLRQRQPRILSTAELRAVLSAARCWGPVDSLRPATSATLLGLLYATGTRIGEALALDVSDLDPCDRLLTIRRGKFGKTRVLPLRESTVEALDRYLRHPMRKVGTAASAPIFVSCRRRRLSHCAAEDAFHWAYRTAGIQAPRPRLHDLRHAFALQRVADWYAQGRDVDSLLPALSTYLGHVSVENTRLYLSANGRLLEHAAARFAHKTGKLDEVAS